MAASWLTAPLEQLSTGSPDGRRWAASTLRSLAATDVEHKDAIAAGGAIPLLVELLSAGSPEAVMEAAGALRALAANNARHQDMIVEAGAVPRLVELLISPHVGVPEQAAGVLMNVAASRAEHRRLVAAAGAVPPLIKAIRCKVVMVTLIVDNVDVPDSGERHDDFVQIIQHALVPEVGHGAVPSDVLVGLTPTSIAHQAVSTPGMTTHCMVFVESTVETAEVQSRIRASKTLGRVIGDAMTAKKLQYNPLRSVRISGITTPSTVSFSVRLKGFDLDSLFDDMDTRLLLAFRPRLQLAVSLELGNLVLPEGVSVRLALASEVIEFVLTPPARVDGSQVLLFLQSSVSTLGTAIIAALTGKRPAEEDGPPPPETEEDKLIKEAIIGELAVELEAPPALQESTYVRSGTRLGQGFAAGALRNVMDGEAENQARVVAEGGVPALVELVRPAVPFGDLFSKMDTDGSGGISMNELSLGLQKFGWYESVNEIWRQLDKDRSGAITYEELVDRLGEESAALQEGKCHNKVLSSLIQFLATQFDDTLVFEQAAGALRNMCAGNALAAEAVIEAGAVPDLIDLMQSKTVEVREEANGALRHLSRPWCDKQVARLKCDVMSERVDAARLLRRLANVNAEHRRTVVAAGAIEPLVEALRLDNPLMSEHAIAALSNIIFKCVEHEEAVVQAGAVPFFVQALLSKSLPVQEVALRATKLCIQGDLISQRKVFDAGGVEVMVAVLKSSRETLHKRVITVLMTLVAAQEYRRHVLKAGFQQVLLEVATAAEGEATRRCAEEASATLEQLLGENAR